MMLPQVTWVAADAGTDRVAPSSRSPSAVYCEPQRPPAASARGAPISSLRAGLSLQPAGGVHMVMIPKRGFMRPHRPHHPHHPCKTPIEGATEPTPEPPQLLPSIATASKGEESRRRNQPHLNLLRRSAAFGDDSRRQMKNRLPLSCARSARGNTQNAARD
ncbi:hypothetical protein NDU88_005350 [Pleurodeles waltl]|uniref:Uncharacterized protein n=1 Tax=Pleurodeles waltl TaxID=8319 RepID=A0AAV7VMZ8_PLEWA|nr:hypothetical protein NDU88_005350 [Pleurodeles waltl]